MPQQTALHISRKAPLGLRECLWVNDNLVNFDQSSWSSQPILTMGAVRENRFPQIAQMKGRCSHIVQP
jgi:hypothetical protein